MGGRPGAPKGGEAAMAGRGRGGGGAADGGAPSGGGRGRSKKDVKGGGGGGVFPRAPPFWGGGGGCVGGRGRHHHQGGGDGAPGGAAVDTWRAGSFLAGGAYAEGGENRQEGVRGKKWPLGGKGGVHFFLRFGYFLVGLI